MVDSYETESNVGDTDGNYIMKYKLLFRIEKRNNKQYIYFCN